MLLAIDAGNTNTVFAVCAGDAMPKRVWRIRADAARTADEYAAFLRPLLVQEGLSFESITQVVVGSVVPSANMNFRKFAEIYIKAKPMFVGEAGTSHGLTITFPHPESLGADRVVNVMAAISLYKKPMILIDFGTATKLEVIDGTGAYIGGIIAPGINQSVDALHMATAKLPKIDIMKPKAVTGTDTISAMRSGIFWGYVSMIEGLVKRLAAENDFKPFVLVTGGLAPLFEGSIEGVDATDEMLTIKGLQMYFARNQHILKAAA